MIVKGIAFACTGVLLLSATVVAAGTDLQPPTRLIERGQYLVQIGGCNECHTPGYKNTGGLVPEQQWLTGSAEGYRGPWGTTFATNLRLTVSNMSAAQWLNYARLKRRPPMPWTSLRSMTDSDLDAVYEFIRWLGPAGAPAPATIPP
jgi:mono/diheme cytochrome c family protein